MPINSTVKISGSIDTTNVADTYPTHLATLGKGGHRTVDSIVERDAIPAERREFGMTVFVVATATEYMLEADLTTWTPSGTTGDMYKAVYDTNDDGIVDNSELLEGNNSAYHLDRSNHTNTQDINTVTGLQTALDDKQDISDKGVAGGYCELDGGGLVPVARLPFTGLTWKGLWDADTNTPVLADGVGTSGDWYKVSVPDIRDLGSGAIDFLLGNWVVYNGATWETTSSGDAVDSVNGLTGIVFLTTGLLQEDTDFKYVSDNEEAALAGTYGTPDGANKFVTDTDPRLNNINGAAGGDLQGNFPNPIVKDLHIANQVTGDIIYYNGTNWIKLPIGANGSILKSNGTLPLWGANKSVATGYIASLVINTNSTIGTSVNLARIKTAGLVLTLPLASAYPSNTILYIKDESYAIGDNPITINRSGSDLIEGIHTSINMSENGGTLALYSDGVSNYYILMSYKI